MPQKNMKLYQPDILPDADKVAGQEVVTVEEEPHKVFYTRLQQLLSKQTLEELSSYLFKPQAIYKLVYNTKGEVKDRKLVMHNPLLITAFYREPATGIIYVQLEFYYRGRWQKLPLLTSENIATTSKITTLANYGVDITSINAREVIGYLSNLRSSLQEELPMQLLIRKPGWEGKHFYLPGKATEGVRFNFTDKDLQRALAKPSGDFAVWRKAYKQLSKESMEARFILACSACAPLLPLVNYKGSPLVLLYGCKGSGKTTILRMAASIWGSSDFIYACDGTLSGFELRAESLNGLPFFMDDAQLLQGKKDMQKFVQTLIYMLYNSTGKLRATKDVRTANVSRWQTFNILSSEEPLTSPEFYGGARRRIIELNLPEKLSRDSIILYNEVCSMHYGFAGRRLLQHIEQFPLENIFNMYNYARNYLYKVDDNRHDDTQITTLTLVVIADMLTQYVTGFDENEKLPVADISEQISPYAVDALKMAHYILDILPGEDKEQDAAYFYNAIMDAVSANYKNFGHVSDERDVITAAEGYRNFGFFYKQHVYINSTIFEELLKPFNQSALSIKKALRDADMLVHDPNRFTTEVHINYNGRERGRYICLPYNTAEDKKLIE